MLWKVSNTGNVTEIEADTALEAAQEYVGDCSPSDWGVTTKTGWVNVTVWREEDGEVVEQERHKITVDPTEPACERGKEHNWQSPLDIVGGIPQNPGVWAQGGGVTIQAVCLNCGCGKLTDTWAQDPEDGVQGLESVEYEPGKYQLPEAPLVFLCEYNAPPAVDRFEPVDRRGLEAISDEINAMASTATDERSRECVECDMTTVALAKEAALAGKTVLVARDEDGFYFATR